MGGFGFWFCGIFGYVSRAFPCSSAGCSPAYRLIRLADPIAHHTFRTSARLATSQLLASSDPQNLATDRHLESRAIPVLGNGFLHVLGQLGVLIGIVSVEISQLDADGENAN